MTITEMATTAAFVLPLLSTACSALSAAIPDARLGVAAKVINALALNFGNATNATGKDLQGQPPKPSGGQDLQRPQD